jgi:lipopolysaccharide transport system permease protein
MVVITVGFKFVLPEAVNGLPYPLFVSSGLIVWLYFSNAVTGGASSFEKFQGIINKVYLPKLALPLASITATLADLLAAALLLVPLMFYYRILPSWRAIFIPIVIFGLLLFVAGLVLFLSVACMKYKDLRHVLPFTMQLLFFGSPIFVPQSLLPEKVKVLFSLNPLGGYIDSFRWTLFESAAFPQVRSLVFAGVVTLVLLLGGILYFQRQQADLVDII